MARSGDDTDRHVDSAQAVDSQARPQAWLRVFAGAPTGAGVRVAAAGATIGRSGTLAQADVLLDDGRASRQHARIAADGAGWTFTDLGSRNGAFVDGATVAPRQSAALSDGAVIRIGDTVAVFHLDAAAAEPGAGDGFFPGISARAHRVRQRVEVLARTSGHVLVLGETGTGKERVARQLGAGAEVVPVNCAELSRELARSELFGHARGAFSGAGTAREGLIDTARHGVLFLDEIAELPLDVQGELLRFLEDGSYRPVGSSELRTSRARVVGATNVDLDDAVRAGTFRRDLLARLRASNPPLSLPPLRDRRLDIPGWADTFLREAVADAPSPALGAGALECLLLFSWPENLRQLRGAIRGAVEPPREWPLQPSRLPPGIQDRRRSLRTPDAELTPAEPDNRADAPTRDQIEAALVQHHGRMRPAAELLNIDRRKLYRLCEKLGIDPETFRRGE